MFIVLTVLLGAIVVWSWLRGDYETLKVFSILLLLSLRFDLLEYSIISKEGDER